MTAPLPATPRRHREIDGGLALAASAGQLAVGHCVLETFPDAVECSPGVAAAIRRDHRDGLLQLIETRAPLAQLSLHRIDSRCRVDRREALRELTLEGLRLVEIFLDGHEIRNREWGIED